MGVASCRCVLPVLMTGMNSSARPSSSDWSSAKAGIRPLRIDSSADRWMAVGMTSLEDWPMFTWSLGCTGSREPMTPPSISMARFAMTSLAFMFVEVPEPVWKTSTTNWSSWSPSATSWAAAAMAWARPPSSRSNSWFTRAAASLTRPSARMKERGNRRSLMGKLSTARMVLAP